MIQSLILWDSTDQPPEHDGLIYTWNGYTEPLPIHSLRQYVDSHGEGLRRKYISFIHDLGEAKVKGRPLKEHLDIGDGFSLWWMSLQAEKSIWKSPSIDTVVRLFALEEIVLQQQPEKFILASANQSLHKALSSFCQNLNIAYEWERLPSLPSQKWSLKRIYYALPHPAQALVFLACHIWQRWPLRKAEKSAWFEGSGSLFFCSYFIQMVSGLAGEGQYYSRFWGDLCGLMRRLGFSGNWLQHYCPHDAVSNPKVALEWVQRFNQQRQEQGFHTFTDAYMSWSVVLCTLKHWLRLLCIGWRLNEIKHAFRPQGSHLSLWPIMREDWYASVCGSVAIDNLLYIELFDRALSEIPHQEKGFYLCENIAWERALIHAWGKHGHGQLIAVVHGVIRFWDMRYFHDLRTIRSSDSYPMPQEDLTVLNGRAAVKAYSSMGYSEESIAEGEALRNGYLHELRDNCSLKRANGEEIKMLILGDFSPSGTSKMLELLEEAVVHTQVPANYTVKPHPLCQVKSADYPSLKLKVVMDPLEEILSDFDIAYSTNLTSAAVDAYLAGLIVVVMLDGAKLNLSPLRGQSDVCFVSTPEELAEALHMGHQNAAEKPDSNDFFFLDPELPRWQKLLSPASST
jgi:surface carbohydrate biosynthesis protein (TIGR04326 family)